MKEKKGVCEKYLRPNKTICESSKKQKSFFSNTVRLKKTSQKKYFELFCKKMHVCTVKIKNLKNFYKKNSNQFFWKFFESNSIRTKTFLFFRWPTYCLLSLKYSSQTPFFLSFLFSSIKWDFFFLPHKLYVLKNAFFRFRRAFSTFTRTFPAHGKMKICNHPKIKTIKKMMLTWRKNLVQSYPPPPQKIFPESTKIATENFYLEGHVFFSNPGTTRHLLKVHCSPVQNSCTENYEQFGSTCPCGWDCESFLY